MCCPAWRVNIVWPSTLVTPPASSSACGILPARRATLRGLLGRSQMWATNTPWSGDATRMKKRSSVTLFRKPSFISRRLVHWCRPSVWDWPIDCGVSSSPASPRPAIAEILAVPGTRLTWAGLCFDAAVRDALLRGFQQQDTGWQRRVADFLEIQVRAALRSLGEGKQPGLGELQARFLIRLVHSLVGSQEIDFSQLVQIWRVSDLSASTDMQVHAVIDRIQPRTLRRNCRSATRGDPKNG